jgi:hypothetical protein
VTSDLREKRKEHARVRLQFWHVAERDGMHHFVTGNESWFFFNTSPLSIWMLSRDHMVTQSRFAIQSKTFMLTIIWNPSCFDSIDRLSNHIKMNSAYFMTNMLIPLEQAIFSRARAPHEKRLVVHLDNCSVHTGRVSTDWLEEHNILRMPHPGYSPDLAARDFCLFPTVKDKLECI